MKDRSLIETILPVVVFIGWALIKTIFNRKKNTDETESSSEEQDDTEIFEPEEPEELRHPVFNEESRQPELMPEIPFYKETISQEQMNRIRSLELAKEREWENLRNKQIETEQRILAAHNTSIITAKERVARNQQMHKSSICRYSLLNNRQNLRQAFIVKEILDRPKCF